MTDRELLQQMIDRIGKKPRTVKFDNEGNTVELNMAGLDLEEIPPEIFSFSRLRILVLGGYREDAGVKGPLGNRICSIDPAIGQCLALEELCLDHNHILALPKELTRLPNLRVLRYEHNNLGQFPPLILELTRLETLWLDGNNIQHLPSELSSLTNLKSLTLNDNQIVNLPPKMAQLVNLEELWLYSNLVVELPSELVSLSNLQTLGLSGNRLTSLPPEIGKLVNLRKLYLHSNQLSRIPPGLAELVKLEELDLGNNQLTDLPPELANLVNLRKLDLGHNRMDSLLPCIGQLTNLQSLSLHNNSLHNIPPYLSELTKLQELHLQNNELRSLPVEIGLLSNLQELWLNDNKLTSLPPELGQLENLQVLWLHENQLTTVPPELGQLTHLFGLWLHGNQLTHLPPKLGRLIKLETLSLDRNHLANLPPELGFLTSLTGLDLSRNHLTSLPPELSMLFNLQTLWLDGNQLASLPAELGRLRDLQTLTLSDNRLEELPPSLGQLTSLKVLWLDNNQLTKLPPELGKLTNLQTLQLANNHLGSLPGEICQLSSLKRLYLNENRLNSLPRELGQLTGLQTLWIDGNQLGELPRSFINLINLEELGLDDNPLRTPPLEIATQGAAAVRAYLARLDNTSMVRFEAKLLLVGEGATGKSSLLRALRGQNFDAHLSTTHGVDVLPISLPCPGRPGVDLTLHVWDFGGQQIYHTTHQFFMTRRSLYLLVWNARGEADQGRLDHWLSKIQVLAPGSPVLLVATHCDERPPQLNLDRFRAAYPQIVGMAVVSNKTGAGIEELKATIAAEAARLPLMEQEWPRAWVDVEEALLATDKTHIDGQEYAAICAAHGLDEAFEQQVLGAYLHDLGKILYYQDDDTLCDFVVLKPNWLTQAMARVLDDDVTRDQRHGVLDHADFARIWAGYDRRLYPVFLRMLERFLISYQMEEREPGRQQSMVPLLLPHSPPPHLPPWSEVLPDQPEVRMVFDLDFVPDGIISWFIVLTHHYSQDLHWREGVRLHYDGHQADVVLNPSTRQLWLHVRGPAPSNFFTILQHTINDRIIRRYFEGLTYRRRVPCICHKALGEAARCTHTFDYDKLVERKQRGRPTIECDRTYEQVSVTELLEGIHYTTHDRLEAKLDAMRAVVDASYAMQVQNQQWTEQLLRETARMWNLLTRSQFGEAPSIFVIMPGDRRSYDPRGLFSEDYLLYLLCQHPAGPHMVAGEKGYQAPKDREWWRQVRPWLRQLSKILKFVPKLSDVAKAYDEQWYKSIELSAEIYDAAAEALPEFAAQTGRVARRELDVVMGMDVEAEGSALRALHVFLREVDKTQHWCGLKKVVTNDGNILWLCAEHARFHEV